MLLTAFIAILQRKRQTAEKALRKKEELIQQLLESRQLPPAQNDNSKADLILLVDEDMEMSDMLEMSLSSEYRIIRVGNGNEALIIAQEVNPDIIISDVVIPGIQGDELCRILKSSVATSHIPVILLTAKSAREAIVHGLEAGASDYIIKPFDMLVLKARIRNILNRRDSLRKDILHVEPQSEEGDYASQMDKEFLNKVINILNEELSNSEFSVDDLCRRLGVSRTVLYNKIKTLTGQPPNDFIKVVRLNKAKDILETHKYMISEVADMVGFSDPKYFSVCYKKQFGISPSKV
jgi:DNA-binding response OmpR family regulator